MRWGGFVLLTLVAACNSPAAPSKDAPLEKRPVVECTTDADCAIKNPHICGGAYEPQCNAPLRLPDHGIPAVHPDGSIWQVCATQPRLYITNTGEHITQRDHYLQREPCPVEPIQ